MGEATVPVDLTNPGQVFACLGLMEAAEVLCGPCTGRFGYEEDETQTAFRLVVDGADPVAATLEFLSRAEAKLITPNGYVLEKKSRVEIRSCQDEEFPSPIPNSPAALPCYLTDGHHVVPIDHWSDEGASGRDNVKFWAGMSGKFGADVVADLLKPIASLGENALSGAAGDPFAFDRPLSGAFRFDWRRDYIPLDAGFSPNIQSAVRMVGHPLVELLAAIGLQHARPHRPDPRDKLAYRYGVSNAELPTVFARAVLGASSLGFPMRVFRMRLGWPGQEGQARCIIDAQEEFAR